RSGASPRWWRDQYRWRHSRCFDHRYRGDIRGASLRWICTGCGRLDRDTRGPDDPSPGVVRLQEDRSRVRSGDWRVVWRLGAGGLLLALLVIFPVVAPSFQVSFVNSAFIAAIGALGLHVVMGLAGLVTAGNAALLAIGAYLSATLSIYLDVPFPLVVVLACLAGAAVGVIVGLPALRVEGIYLAIATLAL